MLFTVAVGQFDKQSSACSECTLHLFLSWMLNLSTTMCQFYQRFLRTFFVWIFGTNLGFSLAPKICTKNAREKLSNTDTTFCALSHSLSTFIVIYSFSLKLFHTFSTLGILSEPLAHFVNNLHTLSSLSIFSHFLDTFSNYLIFIF